jgi:hypothetical protein
MSNAITYRMPYGVPGDLSRPSRANVEAWAFGAAPFASYGIPVKLVAGLAVPVSAVADGALTYGFLVRPFPVTGPNASDPLGTAVPPTSGVANVMNRGYINVKNNAGAPAAGGKVYVRVANGVPATPVGGVEAAAIAGTTEVIPGAHFMGPADANGNCEVEFRSTL